MPDLNTTLQGYLPQGKQSLKPKRHHGFVVLIFICGFLFPPLAVAVRFGIGSDFFINLFLCLLGYFPSHGHNFYIQNIRNNSNKRRTPKWAIKHGLVDPAEDDRKKAKSAWAGRYAERNPNSTLEGADYAEDQIADVIANPTDTSGAGRRQEPRLWDDNEVEFYDNGEGAVPGSQAPNKNKWHYPANFEGAGAGPALDDDRSRGDRYNFDDGGKSKKKDKKSKKASKTAAAYHDEDIPEWGRDYGAPRHGRAASTSTHSVSSSQAGGAGAGSRPRRDTGGDGLNHDF